MKIDKSTNNVFFEPVELDVVITSIVELGGPLNSLLVVHLVRNHWPEYKKILDQLYTKKSIPIQKLPLLQDSLTAFYTETLDRDYGTTYQFNKVDVGDLLEQVKRSNANDKKTRNDEQNENRNKIFRQR